MTNSKKSPWYIWLSFLAFAVLWFDSGRRIIFSAKSSSMFIKSTDKFDLWSSALWQGLLSTIFMFVPTILIAIILEFIVNWMPNLLFILKYIPIAIFYVLGVCVTKKHFLWRKKHLFNKQEGKHDSK